MSVPKAVSTASGHSPGRRLGEPLCNGTRRVSEPAIARSGTGSRAALMSSHVPPLLAAFAMVASRIAGTVVASRTSPSTADVFGRGARRASHGSSEALRAIGRTPLRTVITRSPASPNTSSATTSRPRQRILHVSPLNDRAAVQRVLEEHFPELGNRRSGT